MKSQVFQVMFAIWCVLVCTIASAQSQAPLGEIDILKSVRAPDGTAITVLGTTPLRPDQPTAVLLKKENIRKAIGLSDAQIVAVERLQAEYLARLQLADGAFRSLPGGEKEPGDSLASAMDFTYLEIDAELEERILTKEQVAALNDLRSSALIQMSGLIGYFEKSSTRDELKIDDDQLETLQDRARELDIELTEQIRELKLKSIRKLFDELSPDQKEKLAKRLPEKLLGLPTWSGISKH